jgi:chorismate--pyruvate lyase
LTTKSVLYPIEPNWFTNLPGTSQKIPEANASWIYEPESITRRLRCLFGEVKVEILFHQQRLPFLSESRLLKQPRNRYCLTREVMLSAKGKPLIIARTIIPKKTLIGAQRNLSRLGTRPLGEVIFSYPKLQRLDMQVALIKPSIWSFDVANKIHLEQAIWGRRTVYAINNRQMLVSEFFLPEILEKG